MNILAVHQPCNIFNLYFYTIYAPHYSYNCFHLRLILRLAFVEHRRAAQMTSLLRLVTSHLRRVTSLLRQVTSLLRRVTSLPRQVTSLPRASLPEQFTNKFSSNVVIPSQGWKTHGKDSIERGRIYEETSVVVGGGAMSYCQPQVVNACVGKPELCNLDSRSCIIIIPLQCMCRKT